MSIRILDRVFKVSRSKNGARLVLLALADYSDDAGKSYPSLNGLKEKTLLTERPIQYALREIVALGELKIELNAGPKGCNLYHILLTPAESAPPLNQHPRNISAVPPLNQRQTPAESAPEPSGTVIEPSKSIERAKALSRSPSASGVKFPVGSLERLYLAYPRKKARITAHKAIRKALDTVAKRGTPDPVEWLLERVQAFAKSREGEDEKFTRYPATWFNAGSYDDDLTAPTSAKKPAKDYFDRNANTANAGSAGVYDGVGKVTRTEPIPGFEDEPAVKPAYF